MKLIEKPLNKATVAESCTLAISMALAILKFSLADSYLSDLIETLSNKGKQLQKSIASDRTRAKTEPLVAAHDLRDAIFGALKLFLRGYIQWWREGISEHAKNLYGIVKKHGLGLARENYEEESTLLESMLEEFATTENAESVKSTDLEELVAALNQAQTSFSNLYREAASIEAGKETVVAAYNIKREIRKIEIQTIDYLNVMNKANPATYGAVTAEVAELVNNLNKKIKSRK